MAGGTAVNWSDCRDRCRSGVQCCRLYVTSGTLTLYLHKQAGIVREILFGKYLVLMLG